MLFIMPWCLFQYGFELSEFQSQYDITVGTIISRNVKFIFLTLNPFHFLVKTRPALSYNFNIYHQLSVAYMSNRVNVGQRNLLNACMKMDKNTTYNTLFGHWIMK